MALNQKAIECLQCPVSEAMAAELVVLRKRLDEVHAWIVCAAITSPEDLLQNAPRIIAITDPDYQEPTLNG